MLFEYTTIESDRIRLVPFADKHVAGLRTVTLNPRIWEFLPINLFNENDFAEYISKLYAMIESRERYVFTIVNKTDESPLGITHFCNVDQVNKNLEIGGTWLSPSSWGSGVNTEAKYALLKFCFEASEVERAELRTRETNIRSQKAIEKIGGVREGLLRRHRSNDDGTFRDTIIYSIIRPDWPMLKERLESTLFFDKALVS